MLLGRIILLGLMSLTERTTSRETDTKPFQSLSNVICTAQITCRGVFYMS